MSADPQTRHQAVLDAIGRLIDLKSRTASALPVGPASSLQSTIAGMEGSRRILERHAPRKSDGMYCDRCSYYTPTPFPCGDWTDAAAGVDA